MQLMLRLDVPPSKRKINYSDKVLLVGSCFTEHISDRLRQHRFSVLQNPNGILFNPLSVADSLRDYLMGRQYTASDLFQLNELWNSWDHHTRFSHVDAQAALSGINNSLTEASAFLRETNVLIITLGSAFQYYLTDSNKPVANNHRAPAQWFTKKLLAIDEIVNALAGVLADIRQVNPQIHIVLTISPVRHIRDGVVDNNRSKARLLEAVHSLCDKFDYIEYFPAYELVIDILRDYRYYDIDFVHPNFLATSYVWEHFVQSNIHQDAKEWMQQINELVTARNHRTRFPNTEAHKRFMATHAQKARTLAARLPQIDLSEEIGYFEGAGASS